MAKHIEVIVRGVFRRDDSILVCETRTGGYGYLPGGHIEFDESAAEALKREIREETGSACTVGPLLLTTENRFTSHKGKRHHEITLVMQAHVPDQAEITSLEDDLRFRWVSLSDLNDSDFRPQGVRAWLCRNPPCDSGSPAGWVSENE